MLKSSFRLLLLAFILLVVGVVLPFLIMLGVIPSALTLSMVAYGSSVSGLFLGILGAALYVGEHRRRD